MKRILSLLLVFTLSNFAIYAQTKKRATEKKTEKKFFLDEVSGFKLSYPDSITAVILKNNEDIKAVIEPFVIEVCTDAKPINIADDCYQPTQTLTSKYKVELKEFLCTEGAAGTMYYSFIYLIQKGERTFLLKFLHEHCNACTNKNGKSIPFNKKKDVRWVKDIVRSVQWFAKTIK
jgi:hypothetical protein